MSGLIDGFYTSLILVFYGLAFLNVYKILRQELNPPAAAAWILLNLSIPFIGVPTYYFLGQSKLKAYVKRRKKINLTQPSPPTSAKTIVRRHRHSRHSQALFPYFSSYTGRNDIDLLSDGQEAFSEIFQSISEAKHYILVQYYLFRPDSLGQAFKDALIERAKAGVSIFFIFDNLGSFGLTNQYRRELKKYGIKVARFLPFHLRFHLQVNFRNHRKLVIIDGHRAFLGGMNVGNEYIGRKKFWRDTQVSIKGPAVDSLVETFFDDWNFAVSKKRRKNTTELMAAIKQEKGSPKLPPLGVALEVISFGPGDEKDMGLFMFMKLIQKAKKEILIATPYFIPDLVLERCLELALMSGIEISLLVPRKPDHAITGLISQPYLRKMAQDGAHVHLYERGFMHQKVAVIDEHIAVVGTSNFDNRSIYLNFETCIVAHCPLFSKKVKNMLKDDMQFSQLLDPKRYENSMSSFLGSVVRLLAPLF